MNRGLERFEKTKLKLQDSSKKKGIFASGPGTVEMPFPIYGS